MNCFYISVYIPYYKNSGNHLIFGMFFSSAPTNIIMYYRLITIDLLYFLVNGVVLSVSFEISFSMNFVTILYLIHQILLLSSLIIYPLWTILSLSLTYCQVWLPSLVNPSIWVQHLLFERHLSLALLWSHMASVCLVCGS